MYILFIFIFVTRYLNCFDKTQANLKLVVKSTQDRENQHYMISPSYAMNTHYFKFQILLQFKTKPPRDVYYIYIYI